MAAVIAEEESRRAFGGRYRLLEFVGEGSDARVYVAEDLTLRRRVALKILHGQTAEDERFQERFAHEMRATSALHHPRVLPVYDWGLDPQPYAVTEYLTGGSLAAIMEAGHRLTPSQALVVGLEAARALVNIHAGGRAHLGLGPSSILFDSVGRPYISDLGLAAALGAAAKQPADIGDSDPAGTADAAEAETGDSGVDSDGPAPAATASHPESYSASEQAQDIHDLALVLCEAVTGARVLGATDSSGMVPVSALGPLVSVLERATAEDPAERSDAAGLAQELLRVAPLLPRPDPLPLATHDMPSPDPGVSPIDGTGSFEQVGPSVSERSVIPLDDVPRRRWPGIVLAAVVVLGGAAGGAWAWVASGSGSDPVPQLQGQTRAEAATAAAESGWEVNEILVREPGTRRGEVVRTDPAAGASLGEGAVLDVYISLGEPLIRVSDLHSLYGLTVDDATDELEAVGLRAGGETLVNDEVVPPGNVVGLDAGEGVHELETGAEVDLLVSDGPGDRTVPAVPESRDPALAVDLLDALQLEPLIVMEFSADLPDGTVIAFQPASGSTAPVDATVEVRVSRGPAPTTTQPPIEEGDGTPESEEEDSQ